MINNFINKSHFEKVFLISQFFVVLIWPSFYTGVLQFPSYYIYSFSFSNLPFILLGLFFYIIFGLVHAYIFKYLTLFLLEIINYPVKIIKYVKNILPLKKLKKDLEGMNYVEVVNYFGMDQTPLEPHWDKIKILEKNYSPQLLSKFSNNDEIKKEFLEKYNLNLSRKDLLDFCTLKSFEYSTEYGLLEYNLMRKVRNIDDEEFIDRFFYETKSIINDNWYFYIMTLTFPNLKTYDRTGFFSKRELNLIYNEFFNYFKSANEIKLLVKQFVDLNPSYKYFLNFRKDY